MSAQRPSKKQKEVFDYIEKFIADNGFGPSYREVMRALDLKSVSTVAVHVNGLIAKGLLQKRENSARSLYVVSNTMNLSTEIENKHLEWLRAEIAKREGNDELKAEVESLNAALRIFTSIDLRLQERDLP